MGERRFNLRGHIHKSGVMKWLDAGRSATDLSGWNIVGLGRRGEKCDWRLGSSSGLVHYYFYNHFLFTQPVRKFAVEETAAQTYEVIFPRSYSSDGGRIFQIRCVFKQAFLC